ncbi:MAG: hypothetical protein HY714_00360 [Candidatus Omnitrophica bacterium]|nr:hypothetical protein [Candidatus Omnitrophota bacterium]
MAHWRDVVSTYGEVVAVECRLGVLLPETKLPYPRGTIKKALVEALHDPAHHNETFKNQIELAFLCLDRFVPADQARSLPEIEGREKEYLVQFGRLHDRMVQLCGEFLRDLRERR